jgi:hypothetical protein
LAGDRSRRVVPDAFKSAVKASDDVVRDGVETALKADGGVEGVKVVDNWLHGEGVR